MPYLGCLLKKLVAEVTLYFHYFTFRALSPFFSIASEPKSTFYPLFYLFNFSFQPTASWPSSALHGTAKVPALHSDDDLARIEIKIGTMD